MNRIMTYTFLTIIITFAVVMNAEAKPKPYKVAVCHKGQVIWISSLALPAHLAHGDALAVLNADGTYSCPPCQPTYEHPRTVCPDGTPQEWVWDEHLCEWVAIPCPCDPTLVPKPDCPIPGIVCCWEWNPDKCEWYQVPCPQ